MAHKSKKQFEDSLLKEIASLRGRKVSNIERMFSYSPFSIVSMVLRIKGKISINELQIALKKVQKRHFLLQVGIFHLKDAPFFVPLDLLKEKMLDKNGFESISPDIPLVTLNRESSEDWIKAIEEQRKIPFKFSEEPLIRVIFLNSTNENKSEIILFCHHIICDGMSLANLARDLMVYLSEPNKEVDTLPISDPITRMNMPKEVLPGKFLIKIYNKISAKWQDERITFNQLDYEKLSEIYWSNIHHGIVPIELNERQTDQLVELCHINNVKVNSALSTAFLGAQEYILNKSLQNDSIAIAGDLRKRLNPIIDEQMGFYAGIINLNYKYKTNKSFWKNALLFDTKVKKLYTNKNFFKDFLSFEYLDPEIMEARNFKLIGKLINDESLNAKDSENYIILKKIHDFAYRQDLLTKLLKRANFNDVFQNYMGLAVTNLTRLNFQRLYGKLELDRLIMSPGGAFPLSMINLVIGVVTVSDKMNILIEFARERISPNMIQKIAAKALELLEIEL